MDLRQGKKYGLFLRRQGWVVDRMKDRTGKGFIQMAIRKLPLLPFSVMKCQRFSMEPEEGQLRRLKKMHRVIYSIWEPIDEEVENYCKRKKMERKLEGYLPAASLEIDLRLSKSRLWQDLDKDVKRVIRKLPDVKVEKVLGSRKRWEVWRSWRRSGKGYVPGYRAFESMAKSFGSDMWVMVVRNRDEIVAGEVILVSDKKAYYYHAWTTRQGREMGAQTKLVWEGMIRARNAGLVTWDFEGINDGRRPRKSWAGFSRFKESFGGKRIIYPSSYRQWF